MARSASVSVWPTLAVCLVISCVTSGCQLIGPGSAPRMTSPGNDFGSVPGLAGAAPSDAGWSLNGSVDLCTNTLYTGAPSPSDCNSQDPTGVGYDSGKGEVFVADCATGNVSVISDATNLVVASIPVPGDKGTGGGCDHNMTYDAGRGEIFMTERYNVSVISDATDSVVAQIPVLPSPSGAIVSGMAYDGGKGEVFVAAGNNLTVISDTTDSIVANLSVGVNPAGVVYDSGKGEIFVSSEGIFVQVLSDTNDSIVTSLDFGAYPGDGVGAMAYDPAKSEVFVAISINNSISVISDVTNSVVANIPMGSNSHVLRYDPGKGEVFAVNGSGASVISEATDSVLARIHLGFPQYGAYASGMDYDGGRGEFFVTGDGISTVKVISDTSNAVVASIPVGANPSFASFDGGTGDTFVGDLYSGTVSVFSDATDKIVAAIPVPGSGMVYDSGKGEAFVASIPVVGDPGHLSVISDTTGTVVATVSIGDAVVGMAYDSGKRAVFVASGKNVSVVSDTTNTVVEQISVGSPINAMAYDSGKGELFVGTGENISVISVATSALLAKIPIGAPPRTEAYDSGRGEVFVALTSGNVSVISDATNALVATIPVGSVSFALAYAADAGEVVVADLGSDSVSIISDATNALIATIPVGHYPDGVAYDNARGEILVANSESGTVSILEPQKYAVTFSEVGLPVGVEWWVNISGQTSADSVTATITLGLANATYNFTVATSPTFTATPSSGLVRVQGISQEVQVIFKPTLAPPASAGLLGLSGDYGYFLLGGIGVAGVVGTATALLLRRSRR